MCNLVEYILELEKDFYKICIDKCAKSIYDKD